MPGLVNPDRIHNEEVRKKLPGYECMVCGATEHLAAVPRPMEAGSHPWWVCRLGYGCGQALDTGDRL